MNKQVHFFPSTYHTEETKIHDIAFANKSSSSSQSQRELRSQLQSNTKNNVK